jgi:hypothetical protein
MTTNNTNTDCPMRRDHDRPLWFDLLEGSIVGRGPDITGIMTMQVCMLFKEEAF